MDEEENSLLDHYLEIGAVEVVGIEENGEFIYAVTKKAEIVAPELWKTHVEFLDNALINNLSDEQLQAFINEQRNLQSKFAEYKGFRLEIREEETLGAQQAVVVNDTIKRKYAVALDKDGVVVLKSELSFTLDPVDLIDQLKIIIDQRNLQI